MKKMILFMGLIVVSINLYAQVTISGKVKDNKGHPLPGTSVSLKGSYDGTVVDSFGNFKFTTNEKGEFSLVATILGYNDYEQKITIG
ncbi:MAG TPA: carboxypeptidase-like regulatory domain-containing protein, partial [Chitinophagaceae bacterium]|nr:carboxypeptidase-like regulatory domain-containing protein [Chitinophagaceae bacterium]